MIDPAHDLSITKQAEALNISRGSVYYLPRPVPATDLEVMHHAAAYDPARIRVSEARSCAVMSARNKHNSSIIAPAWAVRSSYQCG